MRSLLNGLLGGVALWLMRRCKALSTDLLKVRAVILYVQVVKAARRVFMSAVALLLYLMLAGGGFVVLHVGLYKLLPDPVNAVTLLILGFVYLLVALSAIGAMCSEDTWLKGSRAGELTERVTKAKDGC